VHPGGGGLAEKLQRRTRPAGRSPAQPAYRNDGLLTAIIQAGNTTDGYSSVLAAAWPAAPITPPISAANSPGPGAHCAAMPAASKMLRPG